MSLIDSLSPSDLMEEVQRGQKRLKSFRRMRGRALKNYVGSHYGVAGGEPGAEAINLTFNAIRVLIPTICMEFPKHTVSTPYVASQQYAELLSLALQQHDRKINIRDTYKKCIVDALFSIGIMKTGLAQSDSVYAIDDEQEISSGEIYTETVDFDDFVADPAAKEHLYRDARFLGHRLVVPRQMLLDSGLYDNDLVDRLPAMYGSDRERLKAEQLSKKGIETEDIGEFEDDVELFEIWVPSANAVVTIPGSAEPGTKFDDYLRVADYYGVKEGPYTLLAFSPPVPSNPLPVPMCFVWSDLHILANQMCKKIIDQAMRQKSITAYKRVASDDAEEVRKASDGEMVAVDDPDAMQVFNMGGQVNSNEAHLENLMSWFNLVASNPSQLGGTSSDAKSATAANILQSNANVSLSDMKDLCYIAAASEARKRCFYLHTDPLINVPLTKQVSQPAQIVMGMQGPTVIPPTSQQVQMYLTPAQRSGDFFDFNFEIEPESMGRVDSQTKLKNNITFATQIMPAVMASAQIAMQLGIPFNATGLMLDMGKDLGMNNLATILMDPQTQQQNAMQQMMGPKDQGKATAQPNAGLNSQLQNGQPGTVQGGPQTPGEQAGQQSQPAAQGLERLELRHALSTPAASKFSGAGAL